MQNLLESRFKNGARDSTFGYRKLERREGIRWGEEIRYCGTLPMHCWEYCAKQHCIEYDNSFNALLLVGEWIKRQIAKERLRIELTKIGSCKQERENRLAASRTKMRDLYIKTHRME